MRNVIKISILYLVLLLLTNCEDILNLGNKKSNEHIGLFSTKWILKEIQHTDTQTKEVIPEDFREVSIIFSDENRVHAVGSCNSFDGDFIIIGSDSIKIYPLLQTEKLCSDDKMHWDEIFEQNLEHSCKYAIKEKSLFLRTDISTIMIFK